MLREAHISEEMDTNINFSSTIIMSDHFAKTGDSRTTRKDIILSQAKKLINILEDQGRRKTMKKIRKMQRDCNRNNQIEIKYYKRILV